MAEVSDKSVKLEFSDGTPSVTLPVLTGSVGPDAIDISTLYKQTGKFTYDPGFMATAACRSSITYIDGNAGKLLYRGYPIEQLAKKCDFLEVCYLLLNGELPNADQKAEFNDLVMYHTMIHEQMQFFLRGFRRDAHPMAVLTGLVGAMSAFYPKSSNLLDDDQRRMAAVQMIAKMPTLVAMAYKYSIGEPYVYAQVPAQAPLRRLRPAWRAFGGPRTAAPTKRRLTCSIRSRPKAVWKRSVTSLIR